MAVTPAAYRELADLFWPKGTDDDRVKAPWFRNELVLDSETNGPIQHANGPCSMLALAHAYMLQQVYFPGILVPEDVEARAPVEAPFESLSAEEAHAALAGGLTKMLWMIATETANVKNLAAKRKATAEAAPNPPLAPSAAAEVAVVAGVTVGGFRPVARLVSVSPEALATVTAACMRPEPAAAASSAFADPIELAYAELEAAEARGDISMELAPLRTNAFVSEAALAEAAVSWVRQLSSAGIPAPVLIAFSMLQTAGAARAAAEARTDKMLHTLIYEDGTAEQSLVNLGLTGRATNHVDDANWSDWLGRPMVGLMTDAEGFYVADCLKKPRLPIFIVISGGHFTTLWSQDAKAAETEDVPVVTPVADAPADASSSADLASAAGASASASAGDGGADSTDGESTPDPAAAPSPQAPPEWEYDPPVFEFHHFNGYKPSTAAGRPTRVSKCVLALYGRFDARPRPAGDAEGSLAAASSTGVGETASEAAREEINKARKVKRVISHRPAPGGTKKGGPFEFLVLCEKDGSMEASALDVPPYWPSRWYCRDCTLKGDYGGYNLAEAMECKACGKAARECGWAHWLSEDEMPRGVLAEWQRSHSPPMLRVVRTRWPRTQARWTGDPPSLFG